MQSQAPILRLGTRGSALALVQANLVARLLREAHGWAEGAVEIRVITTSGDRLKDVPLSTAGGKGLFSREIEAALMAGEIDLGVHSSKDLSTVLPDGLILPVFLEREDVRDAFVSRIAASIDQLPQGARLGTSSIRRAAQMLRHRPDLRWCRSGGMSIRGCGSSTRAWRMRRCWRSRGSSGSGGRTRSRSTSIRKRFPPAPAQGAIGIEVREDDARTAELVAPLNHEPTRIAVIAERAMLQGDRWVVPDADRGAVGTVGDGAGADGAAAVAGWGRGVHRHRERGAGRGRGDRAAAGGEAAGAGGSGVPRTARGLSGCGCSSHGREPEASETAGRLAALDIEAEVLPLFERKTLTGSLPEPAGFAAMALSSANALASLADRGVIESFRALKVFAVGDRTAEAARKHGFTDVVSAHGAFGDLAEMLIHAGLQGPVFYPAARDQSGDLAKSLAPHGVMVVTARVYEMNDVAALDPGIVGAARERASSGRRCFTRGGRRRRLCAGRRPRSGVMSRHGSGCCASPKRWRNHWSRRGLYASASPTIRARKR